MVIAEKSANQLLQDNDLNPSVEGSILSRVVGDDGPCLAVSLGIDHVLRDLFIVTDQEAGDHFCSLHGQCLIGSFVAIRVGVSFDRQF